MIRFLSLLLRGNNNNNNNNCLKSNIQCIEIRVQWTVLLGSSHMQYGVSMCPCVVSSHVVVFGLSTRLLWYTMWMRWLM